jgi:hypothetical protein
MSVPPEESARLAAVRAATQRLAQRLRQRDAVRAALQECSDAVPSWWREGVADAAIFGDGLLSLPAQNKDDFSRPVTLLSAAEISTAAGGEYVPLAWVDPGTAGSAAIALVHDQGDLPVAVREVGDEVRNTPGALGEEQGAAGARPEPVADSLVEFFDMLMPQTLCRFVSGDTQRSVELCDERSLLIERDGQIERREFDSPDEVGKFVAAFMSEALDAGMRTVCCPANMRPLVAGYVSQPGDQAPGQAAVAPEVRAQVAFQRLLAAETLELVEDANLDQLIDDAARFLERQSRAAGSGQVTLALARRFVEWLLQHPAVDDLYADDEDVRAALDSAEAPRKS